jgi:hypothetical protein
MIVFVSLSIPRLNLIAHYLGIGEFHCNRLSQHVTVHQR